MRYALLLAALALSCAADLVLLPDASVPADAGPCGGACGAGTACQDGACVAVDAGAVDAPPVDAGGGMDAVDVPAVDLGAQDAGTPDAGVDAGAPDAGFDAGREDTGPDVPRVPDAGCFRLTQCGNECVDLDRSSDHCGVCGNRCALGQVCGGLVLRCVSGCPSTAAPDYCPAPDGGSPVCTNLASDPHNCRECGRRCATGQVCTGGTCRS